VEKVAVLVVRIARNHPLPDGNKRLAWQSLMFCALNGHDLVAMVDVAVTLMFAVAAGELDDGAVAAWLTEHLDN
jgi:death on curing protein